MSDKEIIVVGYARSGNTYIARLIADALDSPLVGLPELGTIPIGQEGLDRPGAYTVRQLHLLPIYGDCERAVSDPYQFFVNCWAGEKIVLIMRDVRDIAVSSMHYWGLPSISDTIRRMGEIEWPIATTDPWNVYNRAWLSCPLPVQVVRYEELLADTHKVMADLFSHLDIEPVNDLSTVIGRQNIDKRREGFEQHKGHWHPYGTGLQIKTLRKGIAGDWRNCFTRLDGELLHHYFGKAMAEFGYEDDEQWWKKLNE